MDFIAVATGDNRHSRNKLRHDSAKLSAVKRSMLQVSILMDSPQNLFIESQIMVIRRALSSIESGPHPPSARLSPMGEGLGVRVSSSFCNLQ
jgi:hypothetical protein